MLSTIPYHGARRPLEPRYMNDAPRRRTEWRDHARDAGGPRRLAGPFSCPCRLQCCSSGHGVRAFLPCRQVCLSLFVRRRRPQDTARKHASAHASSRETAAPSLVFLGKCLRLPKGGAEIHPTKAHLTALLVAAVDVPAPGIQLWKVRGPQDGAGRGCTHALEETHTS